ncbi:MAG: hypothetical protein HUU32_04725 [Calditrichaceae bacterium]|nr:hypothetical protein [Calditrichaceae bacterium]
MRKSLFYLLLLLLLSCGPKVHFIKVGNQEYPSREKGEAVLVYLNGERPEREYKVIGMVFIEIDRPILFSSETPDSKVIEKLQEEARKHGAHAIIDLEIASDIRVLPDPDELTDIRKMKRAQAKAIVFVEQGNAAIESINNRKESRR